MIKRKLKECSYMTIVEIAIGLWNLWTIIVVAIFKLDIKAGWTLSFSRQQPQDRQISTPSIQTITHSIVFVWSEWNGCQQDNQVKRPLWRRRTMFAPEFIINPWHCLDVIIGPISLTTWVNHSVISQPRQLINNCLKQDLNLGPKQQYFLLEIEISVS